MSSPLILPCVGALVYDDRNRLLLIKRGREPGRGLWSLPGGRVEAGESLSQAMTREVLEETGLVVEAGSVVGTVERYGPGEIVYAITDIAAVMVGGELRAGDDADDARFVFSAELHDLPLSPGLHEVLVQWQALPAAASADPAS